MNTKIVTAIKSNVERGIIAGSQYRVDGETDFFYFFNIIGKVQKTNFIVEGVVEPIVAKTSKTTQFAKCNARNAYKNLTVGKEYAVNDTQKDGSTVYFHIINDAGTSARYNSKFFTPLQTKETAIQKEEKPKEPEIKKGFALCNEGNVLGLETGKQYQVIKDNVNTIEVMIDGKKGLFLKSRFTVGK